MKDGEKLLGILTQISEDYSLNIFDATLKFCELHNCDIESVMEMADGIVIEQLKQAAMSSNMIQKKFVKQKANLNSLMD